MLPLPAKYGDELVAHRSAFSVDRFETLNVDAYLCPACGGSDRDRLMGLYWLRNWVDEDRSGDARVLEIAPSPPLSALLSEFSASYRSGDLGSPLAMDRVDITDMRAYADGQFDAVFCSHVLEHVVDDAAALREMRRVLSPQGVAVLLVPLPLGLAQTDELRPGEPMPAASERIRRFGQDDHVRMYAREDFMARVEEAGFRLQVMGPDEFPDDEFATFALAPRSRLYVAHRG
jgi:SAM-dependent methyltransferase